MAEKIPESVQRWTSKRRTALVLEILKGRRPRRKRPGNTVRPWRGSNPFSGCTLSSLMTRNARNPGNRRLSGRSQSRSALSGLGGAV